MFFWITSKSTHTRFSVIHLYLIHNGCFHEGYFLVFGGADKSQRLCSKKGQQKRLVSTTIPVAQIGTPSVQIDVMDGLGREGPNALNACIGDRRNCMTVVSIMNHKSHGCMIKIRRGGTLKA